MKEEKIKRIVERFFIFYVMEVLLNTEIGNDLVSETVIKHLAESYHKQLLKAGLSKSESQKCIEQAAAWIRNRAFSIQMISTPDTGVPEYYVTFVDEMDSDPDVQAMREALSRSSHN